MHKDSQGLIPQSSESKPPFRLLTWFVHLVSRVRQRLARRKRRLRERTDLLAAGVTQLGAEVFQRAAEIAQRGRDEFLRFSELGFEPSRQGVRPVPTQYYGHGAFMGAAPALLDDPTWSRILAFLMPDVLENLRVALAQGASSSKLMPMMENNPVAAAFGEFRSARGASATGAESPHHLTGIEWDMFVDADLLEEWERAQGHPARMEQVMERAIDTCLIAHANATDTVQETLGLCQYKDVRKAPKTAMGGVEIDSWLDLFGRALTLAEAAERGEFDARLAEMAAEPRSTSLEPCMLNTFAPPWPVTKVVDVYRSVTGRTRLSIIIDIKSLRSTAEFLCDIVRALNVRGVHVAAVGSFIRDEIAGVGATVQHVAGVEYPGPREIQFFHFAGCLQNACDRGAIEIGQSVMFNGASLLRTEEREGMPPIYAPKLDVVRELNDYRGRWGLHIGFYVQEGDCDAEAVSQLSNLVERHPETFELGFAWGGLRDLAHLEKTDAVRLGYGSQRVLEFVGKARQWQVGNSAKARAS
jgi:hypothetical protein